MGVTPAGVEQTVTLTMLQSWRWSTSHLHWRVLQLSREESWREQHKAPCSQMAGHQQCSEGVGRVRWSH